MVLFKSLQTLIDEDFDDYLSGILHVDNEPRKYFYWSLDYFRINDGLTFEYFSLTDKQKDEINNIGSSYFKSSDVYFQVNRNSHRHDLLIKNFSKLFDSKVSNQTKRYEYIKEYVLWQILLDLEGKKVIDSKIVKLQKKNYLISYLTYLIQNTKNPTFELFEGYIKHNLTNKGEELLKRLDELDKKRVENKDLRDRLENLYVLKKDESKIQFVFSRNGGGEKEELRELLEIMGKDDTGKLYRGQANSSWNLDASITREPKYLENEGDMYYDILSLKPDAFQNDQTVYERLITMQHFGMPTRLLDVTRNPLVSIFFACNNLERKDNDGVIFTFKPEKKSEFLNFEDKKLEDLSILFNHGKVKETTESKEFLSKIWFIKGVAKNQRINSQSGDFIFVGNGDETTEKLHQLPKMSIIIDAKSKEILIEQLDSLNIHGGAVYPDLTHMSNYIRNKYLKENKSASVRKVIESLKPDASKAKKSLTKPKKTAISKVVIKEFDFNKIKGKDRATQLTTFSKFYNLDLDRLKKLVEDFLFTEKKPFRDEVADAMKDNPSKLKEKTKIDLTSDKIITLAKMLEEK
jgi:hypothetical protein